MELVVGSTWDGRLVGPEEAVTVRLVAGAEGLRVEVDAPLHGDPPPEAPPGSLEGLWDHEVVEVFLAGPPDGGAIPYTEVEIGPWGHFLVLRLHGARHPVARGLPLELHVEHGEGRWRAVARLDGAHFPPGPHRANAYAIHGTGRARRYLAWHPLPGPVPDFHQPARFPRISG